MIKLIQKVSLITIMFLSFFSTATVVQFQTSEGDFEVNLFDGTTPQTVENFLAYVNSGAYQNTVIHRNEPGFVIQGGGITYNAESSSFTDIEKRPAVINEPFISNVRGTISMAKLPGDPNSATTEWFFNVSNNAANLDNQNGGFTAFGVVLDDGMDVVNSIAAVSITDTRFVVIENIVVTNSAVDTFVELLPPTQSNTSGGNATEASGGSASGGAIGWFTLLVIGFATRKKYLLAS